MAKQRSPFDAIVAPASMAALGALLFTSIFSLRLLRDAQFWAKHTQDVRHDIERVRSSTLEAEAAQKGFLLTTADGFLERYARATSDQWVALDALADLVADNRRQMDNVRALHKLLDTRVDEQKRTLDASRRGRRDDARDIVVANIARGTADAIRSLLATMDDIELGLLDERSAAMTRRYRWLLAVVIGSGITLLGLGTLVLLLNRDIRRRQDLELSLKEVLDRETLVRREAEQARAAALAAEQVQSRRARQASLAADVATTMIGAGALGDLLPRACEDVVRHLDVALVRVWTLSADAQHLELQASSGGGPAAQRDESEVVIPVGALGVGVVAAERKRYVTNDISNDPRLSDLASAREQRLLSFAGYPLLVNDRLLGVFAVLGRAPLPDDTLDTLASVANTIGLGIERKRVEQAVIESERHYRFLADAVPNQVWTAYPNGALDYVNQRVCEYFDRTFDEMLGEGWQSMVHADDLARCVSAWTHCLATGDPYEVEFRLRRAADGIFRAHIGRALPFRTSDGRILKWFGTNTDISERKRGEEEREALYRQAQQAIRTRDDLLASVSHDLRSPLSTIAMAAALLKHKGGGEADGRVGKHASTIDRAVEQMEHLLRDLLDMAAIEAGHLSVDLRPHDAVRLVMDAVELAQPLARAKGLALIGQCRGVDCFVECDRDRIGQVFSNLIGNAIKFTPAGGSIVVTCRPSNTPSVVVFSINDTGPGIAAAELPRIFDRFWQSKEHGRAGAGLGLAICQGIMSQHGSVLQVVSTAGVGTTFTFVLRTSGAPTDPPKVAPNLDT